ncbi:hypothetical protein Vadar_023255 [Vaccinium darrowii]|uniref:Uncharacterized protein n=1 Tax=Vaccinium darrowii TaxID=229202 RepID=A0ACB7Y1I0_9ERIC|nr:hypothetical protein Vadar_023255 [Vaccinium darrowii]
MEKLVTLASKLGVTVVTKDQATTHLHTTRSQGFPNLNVDNGLWPSMRFDDNILIRIVDSGGTEYPYHDSARNHGPDSYSLTDTATWLTTVSVGSIDRAFKVSATPPTELLMISLGKIVVLNVASSPSFDFAQLVKKASRVGLIQINSVNVGEALLAISFPLPAATFILDMALSKSPYDPTRSKFNILLGTCANPKRMACLTEDPAVVEAVPSYEHLCLLVSDHSLQVAFPLNIGGFRIPW